MPFLGETFNAADMPVSDRNYELLPAGNYTANITSADLKDTKSGTGQKIDVRFDITGPTHQGRVVFTSINIRNQSPKAEEIGRQQLGELMRAIGLATLQDTDQLVGGTCNIKVSIKPAENGYEARNEVKGFKALDGSAPPVAAIPAPAPTSAPGGGKPPWAK
jgi:hypothetical protein